MKRKNMCSHKKVEFLGIQELPSNKKGLMLYNCKDCGSTIVITKPDRHTSNVLGENIKTEQALK